MCRNKNPNHSDTNSPMHSCSPVSKKWLIPLFCIHSFMLFIIFRQSKHIKLRCFPCTTFLLSMVFSSFFYYLRAIHTTPVKHTQILKVEEKKSNEQHHIIMVSYSWQPLIIWSLPFVCHLCLSSISWNQKFDIFPFSIVWDEFQCVCSNDSSFALLILSIDIRTQFFFFFSIFNVSTFLRYDWTPQRLQTVEWPLHFIIHILYGNVNRRPTTIEERWRGEEEEKEGRRLKIANLPYRNIGLWFHVLNTHVCLFGCNCRHGSAFRVVNIENGVCRASRTRN